MTQQEHNLTSTEKAEFLRKRGWREEARGPWCWVGPTCPMAHYTLADAYDLERGRKRRAGEVREGL